MRKTAIILTILLTLSVLLTSCAPSEPSGGDESYRVIVTTDALYELVGAIGGGHVTVTNLLPTGAEPHDFEPKPRDVADALAAELFIYNGLGLDAWAAQLAATKTEGMSLAAAEAVPNVIDGDPHVWLSPTGATELARILRDALTVADPANAEAYAENCDLLTDKLAVLRDDYAEKFAQVKQRTFVTGHEAFAYLARDFDLTQRSVEGLYAEGEPTAKQLAELVDFCRDNGVTTIFAESGATQAVADTLARECGATVVTLYTIEFAQDSLTFTERMETNLSRLYEALR
ncbi:MAG: zinc ABC transporter substrate-binding protein [Oscillospiraceae bacterium]|jgi:zinc transport system substrate-binding protein|nr:zinc ABC transporter substrate-binding protein [Oscillospiraceae bacterium]